MANEFQPKSVFYGVMRALRGRKDPAKSAEQSKDILMGTPPTQSSDINFIQQKQQQYLDIQSVKIAQDLYSRTLFYDSDRITAYNDFRSMDLSPEIAAALDIISDEVCTRNERGHVITIYSDNLRIKKILQELFYNTLNAEFNLGFWTRELCKYGDCFLKLEIDQDEGIYDCMILPVGELHKEVGYDGNPKSTRYKWDINNMFFEEWQVAHFCLLFDASRLPYGRSLLDPARKLWKQLQLAEDAMLVYRLSRAPERRIFYIEVGNTDPNDVVQLIEQVKKNVKKSPVVDPNSGQVNLKYNPITYEEDYFLPIRGDKSSKIETLPGACLALDTKIELLDGRSLELKDIISEFENGKQLWSYSINPETGEIVPGKITWAGVTRKNTDVVKITLDNGDNIIVTPDHKFPTKFNGIKQAKDLSLNDSLFGFIKNDDNEIWDDEIYNFVSTSQIKSKIYDDDENVITEKEYHTRNEQKNEIKIHSIEFLSEKMDTGTITIDGPEQYHNFHNFALSVGIFTQNSNLDAIADIEYLQNKLFAAIKVPKTYLNYAESMPGGSTLSQVDLRFARTINRIQEQIILELRRIANVHLYFLGFEDDLDNFTLTLTNPSTQLELLKLETWKARMEVFKELFSADATAPVSYSWAMEYILGFSKSEIKQILRQKKVEKKMFSEIERANDEYMDTGIFKELDEKFRKPDFDAGESTGGGESGSEAGGGEESGGGGFGGSSVLGGLGGGGETAGPELGGTELGGTEAGGAEAGGAEAGAEPEAAPLAENKLIVENRKFDIQTRKMMKSIDSYLDRIKDQSNDNDSE